jgi:hypothetical protein
LLTTQPLQPNLINVVLGHVGIVLGFEVSRPSRAMLIGTLLDVCISSTVHRRDAGSHRCSMTRCCSGFKVQRAKAKLHILARGIPNKAARGELCCGAFPSASSGVEEDATPGRSLAHSPHRRFAFGYRPESACGSVSSAARSKPFVRPGPKKGLWLKLNCDNPTSSTKPRKQGCSMKHDPSIL